MSTKSRGDALQPSETYQPYRLTRRFAVWSFVVIAAILAELISHQVRTELDRTAARYDTFFSRALANDVWADARPLLDQATANGGKVTRRDPAFTQLGRKVRRFISGTPVLAVRMINRRGVVGYATDPSQIGMTVRDTSDVGTALAGGAATKTRFVKSFTGTEGTLSNRWIMSSDLPVPSTATNGQPGGVIELYTDVTEHHAVIRRATIETIAVLIAALLLVHIVLMALVWSAEQAKRAQHLRNLALAEAKARAEAANYSKSEFLANMSHELRTPLNAIIGFSEIMANEIIGPLGKPQYRDYAGDINRSGRELLKIIDRVLELVRAENGTLLLDVGDTNVAYIVHSVRRLLSEDANAAGLTLTAEAREDPLVISTDSGRLREILMGLVSNGIKFTPRGGRVELRVERAADGSGVCIAVIDTGIGMQAGDLPKATALFGQVEHVHSKEKGGIGLGLPYSRKLTEILAGRFEIRTARGRGTTVTITLPWRFGTTDAGSEGPPQLPNAAQ